MTPRERHKLAMQRYADGAAFKPIQNGGNEDYNNGWLQGQAERRKFSDCYAQRLGVQFHQIKVATSLRKKCAQCQQYIPETSPIKVCSDCLKSTVADIQDD